MFLTEKLKLMFFFSLSPLASCQIKLSYSPGMAPQPQEKKTVLDVGAWEQIFQELMQQEKPRARWTLKLDKNLDPNCLAEGWKQYELKGFGR